MSSTGSMFRTKHDNPTLPTGIRTAILLCCLLIRTITASSTVSLTTPHVEKPSLVDLSFLHRTKSSLLAQAILDILQQKHDNVDVDVSASFVEKNISDLTCFLNEDVTVTPRQCGIIAQHNQFTNQQATVLLEGILGPELQEETIKEESKKSAENSKRKKKRRKNEDAVSLDAKVDDVEVLGNETLVDNTNATAAASGNNVTASQEATENSTETVSESNITVVANASESSSSEGAPPRRSFAYRVARLDLGWNDLGGRTDTKSARDANKAWHQILQRTIQSWDRCPTELRFPVCGLGPAACRAMAKGLMARYEKVASDSKVLPPPLSLVLTRNEAIGDPGVAALCAAIRIIATKHKGCTLLDRLDLSGCGITDTGAEALAVALEQNPLCVRHLDLSSNQITDVGVAALGRALAMREGDRCGKLETLDLSNNKVENSAAKALALAMEQGAVDRLILRSCHIYADGAAALVKALRTLALSKQRPSQVHLDLSGNPLGILRKKPKTGGGKYSATALRSKATATTAAYMNLIGKTVQKGLKDLGITEAGGLDTLESDDEEDSQTNEKDKEDEDPSKVKCGALAIADAFFLDDNQDEEDDQEITESAPERTTCKVELGLRHCAFDTRASEALAAVRQELQSPPANMDVIIDVRMNNVLEEDTIAALRGDPAFQSELNEMAERYLEAMAALRIARQRSMEAAKVARTRMRTEKDMEDAWGADVPMGDENDFGGDLGDDAEEAWDSDADYDQAEDEEDFF